jgi:CHRD domain
MKLSLPNNSVRSCLLALASVLILPASAAHADIIELLANLSGAADGTTSPGTGTAEVVLNTAAQTIEINVTFSGLTSKILQHTSIAARHSALASGLLRPCLHLEPLPHTLRGRLSSHWE